MKLAGTRLKNHPSRAGLTIDTKAGPVWTGEVRLNEAWLGQPLHWRRPRMIFPCAHGDLFHESVPDLWIDRVFGVMALAHWHTFQVLTKRSARMRVYLTDPERLERLLDAPIPHPTGSRPLGALIDVGAFATPLPNVWLGVSAEDQPRWDERVGHLAVTPAAVRWVSAEPLVGRIDPRGLHLIHWLVVGGESGPRPTHPDWVAELRDECAAVGTDFFLKQWGSWVAEDQAPDDVEWLASETPRHVFDDGQEVWRVGKKFTGRMLDGVLHDARPGAAA